MCSSKIQNQATDPPSRFCPGAQHTLRFGQMAKKGKELK